MTNTKLNQNQLNDYNFNYGLSRNAIINGNFDVWQRGTSIAMTAANAYTADMWYCETATAGTDKTVSQQTAGLNGSLYSCRVAMVQDQDELLTFSQALESKDSIKFRGQKMTLSFWAKGGAEFVADNATLVSKIVTGKGTDQKVLAFTTSADGVSQNNTLTTSWVKFTCTTTAAIASDITQIGVSFAFTHAGSGTTTNYFEVTQVQLCAGDVALPFMPKSDSQQRLDCYKFCVAYTSAQISARMGGVGFAADTTHAYIPFIFPVPMKTVPTLTVTAADWLLSDDTTNTDLTAMQILANVNSNMDIHVYCTVASGLTAFRPYMLQADGNANKLLYFSADF